MDLSAYLDRIGYTGPRESTRAVLAEVVLRHVSRIPFESIDAYIGRRISLDADAVEQKLVNNPRGGWCFEQNLLLGNALRALGFEVIDLAARVLWNRPAGAVTPRTHRLLGVLSEGRQWLVDGGFGGQTLTGVLSLDTGSEEQVTPHGPFRLRYLNDERVMESLVRDEWLPLCRFDLQPQLPVDFEAANFQLVHDQASIFTQQLVVSRVMPAGRQVLRKNELAFHGLDGSTRREVLPDSRALLQVLREVFGIELGDTRPLTEKFDAQTGSAARS